MGMELLSPPHPAAVGFGGKSGATAWGSRSCWGSAHPGVSVGPGKAALRVQRRLGGEGRRRRLCAPQADGTLDPVAMETALLSQMLLTLKSTQDGISPKITIRRSGFFKVDRQNCRSEREARVSLLPARSRHPGRLWGCINGFEELCQAPYEILTPQMRTQSRKPCQCERSR